MANQTCNPSILTQALGITATGPRTVIVPADPIIWDAETSYEYLTLVASTDFGQAYISKKDVPAGTALTDTEYWIPAASFNAQLAAIQGQLSTMGGEISDTSDAITSLADKLKFADYTGRKLTVFSDSTFQPNGTTGIAAILGEISGATVTNLGVGGYNTSNLRTQVNGLSSIDADYVIVACGVNDFQGNMNPVSYHDGDNPSTYDNVCAIIERIQSLAPSAQVTWVCHAYLHNNTYGVNQTNAFGLTLKEYNDAIEYACSLYGVGVVRLDEIMGINVNNYASQLTESGTTGIHVHFNQTNEYRVAYLTLLGSCVGFAPTNWNGGHNLITTLPLAGTSMIATNLDSFANPAAIAVSKSSPLVIGIGTEQYGTYYVSGFCYGPSQINYNGQALYTSTASGWFCVPFEFTSASPDMELTLYSIGDNAYFIGLSVTHTRNNPFLTGWEAPSTARAFQTSLGNINYQSNGSLFSIFGKLSSSTGVTVTPNETLTTVTGWSDFVHKDAIGQLTCIGNSGVLGQVPARLSYDGQLLPVGLNNWSAIQNVTQMYLSLAGGPSAGAIIG